MLKVGDSKSEVGPEGMPSAKAEVGSNKIDEEKEKTTPLGDSNISDFPLPLSDFHNTSRRHWDLHKFTLPKVFVLAYLGPCR